MVLKDKKYITTGELAKLTRLSRDVINSFRKQGLLPIYDTVSRRHFLPNKEAVDRVKWIQKKRSEGLTLPAIKKALTK